MRTDPLARPDHLVPNTPSDTTEVVTFEDAVAADNRHLAVAVVAMFLMPWAVWGSAIAQANGLIDSRLPQGIALWVLTPSIVVGVLLIGGRPALKNLARRIVRWRAPLWVYAAAVTVQLVIAATTVGLTHAAGTPPTWARPRAWRAAGSTSATPSACSCSPRRPGGPGC